MKKIVSLLLVLLLVVPCALAEELDFSGAIEQEEVTDEQVLEAMYGAYPPSDLLSQTLPEGKKTVTILSHYSLGETKEYFNKLFGGEIVEVICGVSEYASKLTNMIASGNAPDLVVCESSINPSVAVYANAGLVQPFDPYIDYTVPELAGLKDTYDAGIWNGSHYLAPYTNKPLYFLIYNPVIFEEYGMETPWELWEKGEWTWNEFRDLAQQLNVQDADGSWLTFGTAIPPCSILSASTGVDYLTMGDGTFTINLNNPSIVRAENFINDMIFKDDIIKIKAQNAWKAYWNRGKLAMQIVDSWMFEGDGDISKAAKNGRLGIAPLPQDPEYNVPGEYHTYSQSGGFCLVNGAKNPEGAALFIRMLRYTRLYEVPEIGVEYQTTLERLHEKGFTNEVLLQKVAAWDTSKAVTSFGYGIMAELGIWEFMGNQNNWTSYVETILPNVQETVRELTEKNGGNEQ